MLKIKSKKDLAKILSKLSKLNIKNVKYEQYETDPEIASFAIWFAYLNNDIANKTIADLGAGNGILGIGCALLNAKLVYFVEKDDNAVKILKENIKLMNINNCIIKKIDINDFNLKVDTVIENPPFGTKIKHHDILFLEKAMDISSVIYSFHKSNTINYIKDFCNRKGFDIVFEKKFKFPIKHSFSFHKKPIKYVDVSFIKITKSL